MMLKLPELAQKVINKKPQTKKRWWTKDEVWIYRFVSNLTKDMKLQAIVKQYGPRNWKKVASFFSDRTDVQCLHRWQKVLNPNLTKGPWTKEEDEIVKRMVAQNGPRKWSEIAKFLEGRIGKQCRER